MALPRSCQIGFMPTWLACSMEPYRSQEWGCSSNQALASLQLPRLGPHHSLLAWVGPVACHWPGSRPTALCQSALCLLLPTNLDSAQCGGSHLGLPAPTGLDQVCHRPGSGLLPLLTWINFCLPQIPCPSHPHSFVFTCCCQHCCHFLGGVWWWVDRWLLLPCLLPWDSTSSIGKQGAKECFGGEVSSKGWGGGEGGRGGVPRSLESEQSKVRGNFYF